MPLRRKVEKQLKELIGFPKKTTWKKNNKKNRASESNNKKNYSIKYWICKKNRDLTKILAWRSDALDILHKLWGPWQDEIGLETWYTIKRSASTASVPSLAKEWTA